MDYCVSKFCRPAPKLTDRLIYLRKINTAMKPEQREFVIFSTKSSEKYDRGLMVCHEHKTQLRDDYNGKTLAIDFIETNCSGKGFAKDLINFAKIYSKQVGCNGYIVLKSDPTFTPERIPQLFYRKQGFSTLNNETDAKMDKFIRKNKNATSDDFGSELMFYPPKAKKQNFFQRTVLKLKDVFTKNLLRKL